MLTDQITNRGLTVESTNWNPSSGPIQEDCMIKHKGGKKHLSNTGFSNKQSGQFHWGNALVELLTTLMRSCMQTHSFWNGHSPKDWGVFSWIWNATGDQRCQNQWGGITKNDENYHWKVTRHHFRLQVCILWVNAGSSNVKKNCNTVQSHHIIWSRRVIYYNKWLTVAKWRGNVPQVLFMKLFLQHHKHSALTSIGTYVKQPLARYIKETTNCDNLKIVFNKPFQIGPLSYRTTAIGCKFTS